MKRETLDNMMKIYDKNGKELKWQRIPTNSEIEIIKKAISISIASMFIILFFMLIKIPNIITHTNTQPIALLALLPIIFCGIWIRRYEKNNGADFRQSQLSLADALDLSIQKWEKIIKGNMTSFGKWNCHLCYLYEGKNCKNCPAKKTNGCNDTPYDKLNDHHDKEHCEYKYITVRCPECKNLAIEQLEYLKSLKEVP